MKVVRKKVFSESKHCIHEHLLPKHTTNSNVDKSNPWRAWKKFNSSWSNMEVHGHNG